MGIPVIVLSRDVGVSTCARVAVHTWFELLYMCKIQACTTHVIDCTTKNLHYTWYMYMHVYNKPQADPASNLGMSGTVVLAK
jgi:hypothetical protein